MVGCDEWMRWMNYVNEEKLTGAHQRERKNSKREEKFWRAPKREGFVCVLTLKYSQPKLLRGRQE